MADMGEHLNSVSTALSMFIEVGQSLLSPLVTLVIKTDP